MEAIRIVKRVKNNQMLIHLPNNYENAKVEVIVLLVNSEEGSEDVPDSTIALDESPPIEYIDEIDRETQIVDNHFPKAMEERLEFSYQQMAKDERRESEALEWAEATIGDISDETR